MKSWTKNFEHWTTNNKQFTKIQETEKNKRKLIFFSLKKMFEKYLLTGQKKVDPNERVALFSELFGWGGGG